MKNKNITFGTYMLDWYMIYKYPKHAITTRNVCLTYINVHIRPSNINSLGSGVDGLEIGMVVAWTLSVKLVKNI